MNRAPLFYMLLMALIAAFVLSAAPIEAWIRIVLAALVAGVEIGLLVANALQTRLKH